MNIVFTEPTKDDIHQILDLFSKNDPDRSELFTEKYYEWQFVQIPGGPAKQLVVKDNGTVVGFGALLPFNVRIGSKTETMYEGVEFVVAPAHRGQGIFTKLASKLYDSIGPSGTFAFASIMSFKIYQERLSHRFIGYFPYWIGIVDLEQLMMKKLGVLTKFIKPLIASIEISKKTIDTELEVRSILNFSNAWNIVGTWKYNNGKGAFVNKNSDYLNWRYINHPLYRYDVYGSFLNDVPTGFVVLRGCNIVDIGYASLDICNILIIKASNYFRENKILCCHSYLSLETGAIAIMNKNGFIHANNLQCELLKKYCYPRQRMLIRGESISTFMYENCMMTMGDIDSKL